MNKKKIIITIIIIFIITGGIVLIANKINKDNSKSINEKESIITDSGYASEEVEGETLTALKKVDREKSEKFGVSIENIEIKKNENEMWVNVELKNTTKNVMDGIFITMMLLDKNGKEITTIAKNISSKIKADETYKFSVFMEKNDNNEKITDAKIITLTVNNNTDGDEIFKLPTN